MLPTTTLTGKVFMECLLFCMQISRVNRLLADEVDTLSSNTENARMRLTLFIQWWAEYCDNYDDLSRWLEGAETRLQQLVARAESTQPPLVSPAELLIDVQVGLLWCKDLAKHNFTMLWRKLFFTCSYLSTSSTNRALFAASTTRQ